MSQQLQVRFGGYSSAGVKAINQDAFTAHLPEGIDRDLKGAAAVICDGVSSGEESQVASQMAATVFITDYFSTPPTWSTRNAASKVLQGLNSWIHRQNAARNARQDSMLTTFSAVITKSNTLHSFHVGDSRIHHLRGHMFEQITRDHTLTEGGREYLARALGADSHLEVDYHTLDLAVGDRVLLTTDGVHGVLSRAALRELLAGGGADLEACARRIVDAAAQAGSDDNLTALIVSIDQLPLETLDETHRRLTQLPIPPVLASGNRIDGFEVLDVIFSGTRSHMYLVKDSESGQRFVLKAPSGNFAEDAVYLDGFIREEWVGQRIDHPNVMKTYRPPREKRFLYYLGEHIEGMNLREWLQDNPKPPLDAVRDIVRQAIAGLRAFQRADMVHQDLKPENIMINRDGRVKLLDFGTVMIAGTDEIASPLDKSVPQGSVNYVAPEYLMGEAGSFRSDLFSLAVITYEMITGELPFDEPAVKRVSLDNYGELDYIPANRRRHDLPLWIEGCLRKALQPNPAYRYDAFSEFLQDFTHPNPQLEAHIRRQPLLQKNPLRFWKVLCAVLVVLNLLQLAWG
ncbi:MAG: protein kinase [Rhodocyclaceae bacterium]|nr:bifunctional protein-serine/threonine kinase/phosphatase [Rhodocyclaceae bacterium]MCP5233033.1 bifunctional protein-serine/threonine kinase/phosphatase [Zoogloeaceae bacterium]MCP5239794.1 bifunctional protein-serine/threonine kinase/phosphatase [Zoogloeaceae bacterium]MCP5253969.1 bifunctional protein-serine/threonine kinase/phosphatase [Zoogloeaceae bacterium]MCP5293639.1 bifunctional protein-serine/threonine kinase/phosphatase [Zoogloeaceae bacterium]